MSDFNVLERIFGFLSHGTSGVKGPLESEETYPLDKRRVPFDPMMEKRAMPPEDGRKHVPIDVFQPDMSMPPDQQYIRGELDSMASEAGIASDDPYQLEAKLEAWKRYGHPATHDEDDRRKLREWLERR